MMKEREVKRYAWIFLVILVVLSGTGIRAYCQEDTTTRIENAVKPVDPALTEKQTIPNGENTVIPGINDLETPPVNEETVTRGNSLFTTVKQGGPLMIVILLLAIASLTLIIERLLYFTRNNVWKSDRIELDLRKAADESESRYREDMEDELRAEFQLYSNNLERGLGLLSGIGNVSPIVGFLGTVIGMINAFASIAAATTVNAKVVAVGIQIALVTTAGGLLVAAPTLIFFYFFVHVIQNRYVRAEEVISDICEGKPRLSDRLCAEEGDVG